MKGRIPERGDIVWLEFDQPPTGHEQGGHRPALVVSHYEYNRQTGLCMCCPMTSRAEKPWPWLVKVDEQSAVIADQLRCMDWKERKAKFKQKASPELVEKVVKLFKLIILPL